MWLLSLLSCQSACPDACAQTVMPARQVQSAGGSKAVLVQAALWFRQLPFNIFIQHYMQLRIITECEPHVHQSIPGMHKASQQRPTQSRHITKLTQLWLPMCSKVSTLALLCLQDDAGSHPSSVRAPHPHGSSAAADALQQHARGKAEAGAI